MEDFWLFSFLSVYLWSLIVKYFVCLYDSVFPFLSITSLLFTIFPCVNIIFFLEAKTTDSSGEEDSDEEEANGNFQVNTACHLYAIYQYKIWWMMYVYYKTIPDSMGIKITRVFEKKTLI